MFETDYDNNDYNDDIHNGITDNTDIDGQENNPTIINDNPAADSSSDNQPESIDDPAGNHPKGKNISFTGSSCDDCSGSCKFTCGGSCEGTCSGTCKITCTGYGNYN